jgi:dienelactone hydrolase
LDLLAERLISAASWLQQQRETRKLPLGLFGASTGAAAALIAAVRLADVTGAIVSCGGRPDLAGPAVSEVRVPTLLIVGGNDQPVIMLNRAAFERFFCEKRLEIVPGATHLFEEPGALEKVAELSCSWFIKHLNAET